jgi:glycosyltransferase involved in cell wall biosynthesis
MIIALAECYSAISTPAYRHLADAYRQTGERAFVLRVDSQGVLRCLGPEDVDAISPRQTTHQWRHPNARSWAAIARQMALMLHQLSPDVVFVNMARMGWLLPVLGPKALYINDVRQAGRSHDESLRAVVSDLKTKGALRLGYKTKLFERVSFLTPEAAQWALGSGWARAGLVIPLGVPTQFSDEPVHPVTSGEREFIYSGTISRTRRLETLVEAAGLLKTEGLRLKVTLLGPDAADGYYHRLVGSQGLSDVVALTGPLAGARLAERLAAAHVALAYIPITRVFKHQPSLKALEYRALGLPMIGTNTSGNRDLIQPDQNGLIVDDNAQSLAAAMRRYITDGAFFSKCRAWAAEHRTVPTWPEVATDAVASLTRLVA